MKAIQIFARQRGFRIAAVLSILCLVFAMSTFAIGATRGTFLVWFIRIVLLCGIYALTLYWTNKIPMPLPDTTEPTEVNCRRQVLRIVQTFLFLATLAVLAILITFPGPSFGWGGETRRALLVLLLICAPFGFRAVWQIYLPHLPSWRCRGCKVWLTTVRFSSSAVVGNQGQLEEWVNHDALKWPNEAYLRGCGATRMTVRGKKYRYTQQCCGCGHVEMRNGWLINDAHRIRFKWDDPPPKTLSRKQELIYSAIWLAGGLLIAAGGLYGGIEEFFGLLLLGSIVASAGGAMFYLILKE